ncbi:MAG: sulfite exporter TauE/SafE family protein [Clostridia bacterium]|nr:sulfite exporter TauE/SafE family protein [Clostridia bacterium]
MEIFFGLISGIVTSLGMGGGTILILLLTIFLNIDQHISQATNLIFFIPTSLVATLINVKNKKINFQISKKIITYGVIGAIIGSFISGKLPNQKLKKIFGIFLFIIAIFQIYEIYTTHRKNKKTNTKNK